jgi:NRPS condensation-like uncharacterized protein
MKSSTRIPAILGDRFLLCLKSIGRMVISADLTFDHALDPDRLKTALERLPHAEPILGCRLIPHPQRPWWEPLDSPEPKSLFIANTVDEMEGFFLKDIEPEEGPKVQAALLPGASRLALKVDHAVCDAAGVKEVVQTLAETYTKLGKDPGYRPPRRWGPRTTWAVHSVIPWQTWPRILASHIREIGRKAFPTKTLRPPMANQMTGPVVMIRRVLEPDVVNPLIRFGRMKHATLNDLLVAGFFRALVRVFPPSGGEILRLITTVDLRRYFPVGKTPGLANLSGFEYFHLGPDAGEDFVETLNRVSTHSHSRKAGFIGLNDTICSVPLFSILPHAWLYGLFIKIADFSNRAGNLPPTFTNLGPLDPESFRFDEPPSKAALLCPPVHAPFFGAAASGYQGTLTLTSGTQPDSWLGATPDAFFDAWVAELCEAAGV